MERVGSKLVTLGPVQNHPGLSLPAEKAYSQGGLPVHIPLGKVFRLIP